VTLSFYLFLEQHQAIVLASKSNLRFATVCWEYVCGAAVHFTPVAPIAQQRDHWCDLWIGNWIRLQRLLPLKRALTEVEHDVQDTHVAMDQVPFSYTWAFQITVSCFQIVRNLRSFWEHWWWWVQVLSSDDLLQALCLENDELATPVAENSTHRE
jgi:hypothetical protein